MTLDEKMRGVQDVVSIEILKRLYGNLKVGERIIFDFIKEPSEDFPFLCMQLPSREIGDSFPSEYYGYKSNMIIDAGKPITEEGKRSILRWSVLGVGYPGYKMAYRNGSSNDWLEIPITDLRTGVWSGDTDGGVQYHQAYPHRSIYDLGGIKQTRVVHLQEPFAGNGYVYEYMGGI